MTEEERYAEFHRFRRRLERLGIKLTFAGNIPWIYIKEINGAAVKETYFGEHGFTAFLYPMKNDETVKFTDRREVFKLIRKYIETPHNG